MQNWDTLWELFTKLLWPLLVIYATYLHRSVTIAYDKIERLQHDLAEHRVDSSQAFATQSSVQGLENKLVAMLNRIDDKVTQILRSKE